jgi:hypothetical protein
MEYGVSASVINDLRNLGHVIMELEPNQALAIEQAIVWTNSSHYPEYGPIFAASDYRKDGYPSGY